MDYLVGAGRGGAGTGAPADRRPGSPPGTAPLAPGARCRGALSRRGPARPGGCAGLALGAELTGEAAGRGRRAAASPRRSGGATPGPIKQPSPEWLPKCPAAAHLLRLDLQSGDPGRGEALKAHKAAGPARPPVRAAHLCAPPSA